MVGEDKDNAGSQGGRSERPRPPEDTLFLASSARADAGSEHWAPLSAKILGFLQSFRHQRMPPRVDFEDFCSEVILRVLRDLPGVELRDRKSFWAWLKRVAENTLVDLIRSAQAKKRGAESALGRADDEGVPGVLDADPNAEPGSMVWRVRELEQAELLCVDKLPTELGRNVYLLRRQRDLPFEEIATRVGHRNAAASRYVFFRMKELVQTCLRRRLEDGYATFFARLG